MYFLYRISSSYDGFTPDQIPHRLEKMQIFHYNWNIYFDQVERGDIVFTYFIGRGVKRGIYLIAKITKLIRPNTAIAKVLLFDSRNPILPGTELSTYKEIIFNRPRGSIFVIPTFLDPFFDKILRDKVISDIEITEQIDCHACFRKNVFPCDKCSIFDRDYIINFSKEVVLMIPGYETFTAPFWVIPHRSYWTKTRIRKHTISKIFYSFKAGFSQYTRLFARGIREAIETHPDMKNVDFDLILGVPLSPKKKKNEEFDRVKELCLELSKITRIEYIEEGLSLSKHISRKEYRGWYSNTKFIEDYCKALDLDVESLDGKNVLVIDDVITDGMTLRAIGKKIKESFPRAVLFGAAGAIMAKKRNVSSAAVKKFKR